MPTNSSELPPELRSVLARDRRSALRALGELTPAQRLELRAIRASEPDAWARRAMDERLGDLPPRIPIDDDNDETLVDPTTVAEIRSSALADAAELMAHEVRHSILHIEIAAEREIDDDYQSSDTKKALDSLRSIARSLSQLANATKSPSPVELSLPDLVINASADATQSLWPPQFEGPAVEVRADPDLLRLAVSNCLRNAIDASDLSLGGPSPVLITWGKTDRDAWVAIHDDGIGLPFDIAELFEPHHTTKGGSGHTGLGLTIAQSAMAAMDGKVTLEPRLPRGAICEIRWPQEGAS